MVSGSQQAHHCDWLPSSHITERTQAAHAWLGMVMLPLNPPMIPGYHGHHYHGVPWVQWIPGNLLLTAAALGLQLAEMGFSEDTAARL